MNEQAKLPTSFWVISVIALIWNAMGVMSFFMQVMMSEEALAALPEAERALYESSPVWMNFLFALAVFGGTIGCIGLLMKKAWAETLFLVSLITVIIQMGYWIFLTKSVEVYGPTSVIMPLVVIAIAVFLLYYSRQCKARGWLS